MLRSDWSCNDWMAPYFGKERKTDKKTDSMQGAYLGPQYSNNDIKVYLDENGFTYLKLEDDELPEKIADLISQKSNRMVSGRMEFGPEPWEAEQLLVMLDRQILKKQLTLK